MKFNYTERNPAKRRNLQWVYVWRNCSEIPLWLGRIYKTKEGYDYQSLATFRKDRTEWDGIADTRGQAAFAMWERMEASRES